MLIYSLDFKLSQIEINALEEVARSNKILFGNILDADDNQCLKVRTRSIWESLKAFFGFDSGFVTQKACTILGKHSSQKILTEPTERFLVHISSEQANKAQKLFHAIWPQKTPQIEEWAVLEEQLNTVLEGVESLQPLDEGRTFKDVKEELFQGQGWGEKGAFLEPSTVLKADIGRMTYGLAGQTPVALSGSTLFVEEQIGNITKVLRSQKPNLTDQQIYLLLELMTQTTASEAESYLQPFQRQLMGRNFMHGQLTERTVEYDFKDNKAIVKSEMPFDIHNIPTQDSLTKKGVSLREGRVILTFEIDLNAKLEDSKVDPAPDVLRMKIEYKLL